MYIYIYISEIPDSGFWFSDSGCQIPDSGFGILDSSYYDVPKR